MRYRSYFNTAVNLLENYSCNIPLTHYLKNYFSQNKKHGGRDRKLISHLCYCYFRIGFCIDEIAVVEKLKIAVLLCNDSIEEWSEIFDDEWMKLSGLDLNTKISFLKNKYAKFSIENIFPFQHEMSDAVDASDFSLSHLFQPKVFVRIRPGKHKIVIDKLNKANIYFEQIDTDCFAFSNAIKLEDVLLIDKEIVIQDYSSQQIDKFLMAVDAEKKEQKRSFNVWDCCAASGGKSILAKDVLQNIQLTVSDIRTSILKNLQKRFLTAGINLQHLFTANAAEKLPQLNDTEFDLIICDAPCTGSGTWSRTPEQLGFFSAKSIDEFSVLQQKISLNVIAHLKANGYFLYITCSVFKKENEDVVDYILANTNLQLLQSSIIKGYDKKADTMFAALFKATA